MVRTEYFSLKGRLILKKLDTTRANSLKQDALVFSERIFKNLNLLNLAISILLLEVKYLQILQKATQYRVSQLTNGKNQIKKFVMLTGNTCACNNLPFF